ncbi:hypothetical protein ACTXT7_012646, partial [Hymenolepis weldensis]
MPADLNFGKKSKMRSRKNNSTNQTPDQSGNVSTTLETIPNYPSTNENGLLEEREFSDLQDLCQCYYDKPKCSDACEQATENKQLQVNVADLQKTIKELQNKACSMGVKAQSLKDDFQKSDCSKCQNEEPVEILSRTYSEEPNCGCSHAQQVRRLKEKVKELRIR